MNDVLLRALTGTVFIGLIIGGLFLGTYATAAVIGLFTVLGLREFYKIYSQSKFGSPDVLVGMAGGLSIFFLLACMSLGLISTAYIFAIIPILFLSFIPELYRASKTPLPNLGLTIFGWIYIVLPMFFIILLREDSEQGWLIPLGMFLMIWANDTFAYLTGRMIGKTKLFERLSPKKTWEGTVGGIIFACAFGALFANFSDLGYAFWIPAAFLAAVGSIFGDLFESMMKRSLGIKDTGTILPGHGGILDRFDAALYAAPLFFTWLMFYHIAFS